MGEKRRIENVIQVLEENYLKIMTVYEWAGEMGYSRSCFSRLFKKEFGLCPKDQLKTFRLKLIKAELRKNPDAIGYEVAVNTGFSDSKSLRKFLYTHYDTNLTTIKAYLAYI